jgi:hypothetical protein
MTMIPRIAWAIPLSVALFGSRASASDAVDLAARLIGRPYVWGAEGPNAFDCSGLTQYVYQEVGIDLPRRAVHQSRVGTPAGRRLRRGDLLFFSTNSRRSLVTHVGIYEGGGIMIDASKSSGEVRRDNLNDEYWAERFMFARRITSDARSRNEAPNRRARDDGRVTGPPARPNGRRAAIRVLEEIARTVLRPSGS